LLKSSLKLHKGHHIFYDNGGLLIFVIGVFKAYFYNSEKS